MCNYAASNLNNLNAHKKIHDKKFKCQNCNKKFLTKHFLEKHLKPTNRYSCFKTKDFSCKMCGKVFKTTSHFNQHLRSHAEPVQCPICKEFFSTNSIRHQIEIHETENTEPKFKCQVCSQKFFFKERLTCHLRTHTKPFECDVCGQNLKSKFQLQTHFDYHLSSSSLKCQECQIVFTAASSLKKHLKIFTEQKIVLRVLSVPCFSVTSLRGSV